MNDLSDDEKARQAAINASVRRGGWASATLFLLFVVLLITYEAIPVFLLQAVTALVLSVWFVVTLRAGFLLPSCVRCGRKLFLDSFANSGNSEFVCGGCGARLTPLD